MIRTGVAAVFSFVLLLVESMIVMKIKGYTNIVYYDNLPLLISVLAMNFFFAFSIFTQGKAWLEGRNEEESEIEKIK